VRAMLVRFGYQVLEAETPEQAVEIASGGRDPIHLLLTDIVMPRISGFDLAKSIRAIRPGIKVLYMSGYTDTQVSSMSNGWVLDPDTPFIQKPFTVSALTRKVREALGSSATAN
jgi:two-component system cell cycle sensor histidine kinase/response regulator CckA